LRRSTTRGCKALDFFAARRDEYLVEKIFEQRICSPHRDVRLGNNFQLLILSPLNTVRHARSNALCTATGSREKKMKKTIFTIAGSALIALSAVQFAAASEHQERAHHRIHASAQFRDTNAYAAPAQPEWSGYRYSGGYSAPAGR
jgi:hypothetical protein